MEWLFEKDNWKDYAEKASRTNSSKDMDAKMNLTHVIMGLVGELGELVVANSAGKTEEALSEVGDIIWYLSQYEEALNGVIDFLDEVVSFIWHKANGETKRYSFIEEMNNEAYTLLDHYKDNDEYIKTKLTNALICASSMMDEWKKIFIYGQPYTNHSEKTFSTGLSIITDTVLTYCEYKNVDKNEIANRNLLKLKARFPDKFTVEDSMNRDYEKESEASGLKGN